MRDEYYKAPEDQFLDWQNQLSYYQNLRLHYKDRHEAYKDQLSEQDNLEITSSEDKLEAYEELIIKHEDLAMNNYNESLNHSQMLKKQENMLEDHSKLLEEKECPEIGTSFDVLSAQPSANFIMPAILGAAMFLGIFVFACYFYKNSKALERELAKIEEKEEADCNKYFEAYLKGVKDVESNNYSFDDKDFIDYEKDFRRDFPLTAKALVDIAENLYTDGDTLDKDAMEGLIEEQKKRSSRLNDLKGKEELNAIEKLELKELKKLPERIEEIRRAIDDNERLQLPIKYFSSQEYCDRQESARQPHVKTLTVHRQNTSSLSALEME